MNKYVLILIYCFCTLRPSFIDAQENHHYTNAEGAISETPTQLISDSTPYVVIGIEDVLLEGVIVHRGGIGVTEPHGDLDITDGSMITAEETFIDAPDVLIDKAAEVRLVHAIPAAPILEDFLYNLTGASNDLELHIGDNETVTLTENIYEDIFVGDGATLTFSGHSNVYLEELRTSDNVTVLFDQCTNLIIRDKFRLGKYNAFNPEEEDVLVFAEDDAEIKKGSTVYGLVYTLDKLRVRKAKAENPTYLQGVFIGEDVKVQDHVELWLRHISHCYIENATMPPSQVGQPNSQQTPYQKTDSHHLKLYPNPATATLTIERVSAGPSNLQLLNTNGQSVLTTNTHTRITIIDISRFPPGIYYVQMTDHEKTVTKRILKQ